LTVNAGIQMRGIRVKKKHCRWDNYESIFLVLKMNANGDGAVYAQSLQRTRLMNVVPPGDEVVSRTMCDVTAYWMSTF